MVTSRQLIPLSTALTTRLSFSIQHPSDFSYVCLPPMGPSLLVDGHMKYVEPLFLRSTFQVLAVYSPFSFLAGLHQVKQLQAFNLWLPQKIHNWVYSFFFLV